MRRRLTIAILALVAATLVVTSIGSFEFIKRAALSTAQQELAGEGRTISQTISNGSATTKVGIRREFKVIAEAGDFDALTVVYLQARRRPGGQPALRPHPRRHLRARPPGRPAGQRASGVARLHGGADPNPVGDPRRAGGGGHQDRPRPDHRPALLPPRRGHRPRPGRSGGRGARPPLHPAARGGGGHDGPHRRR